MSGLRAYSVDEGLPGGSGDRDDGHRAMVQTLAACGELAGAAATTLLAVEPASLSPIILHTAGAPAIDIGAAAMRAAIEREAALMFPAAGPNWVSDDGRAGATAFARVAGTGASTYVLALSLAAASPVARARVARLMPTLIALVAAQIEAEDRFAALEAEHAARVLALDHGHCGIIAVRDDHSVLFTNAAAAAMLAAGDPLHVRRGVVRPADYRQVVRFEAALDAVQEHPGAGAAGKPPALVMLLPSEHQARPLIVTIAPARATPAPAPSRGAAALIYLFQQDMHSVQGLDTIAELHGLSGVERRLLAQLCAGLTVAESAERLRIKLETARAYLKQIFAKTGTHRQTELVALMIRYLRVMRGDFDFRPA